MSNALLVYVGADDKSLTNLEHGLRNGRWAFTAPATDLSGVAIDELVVFGTGVAGGPRQNAARWQAKRLPSVFIARVTGAAFDSTAAWWPDETASTTLLYRPSIPIAYLGQLGDLSLSPGVDLSLEAVEAMRRSGIQAGAGQLVSTTGSPALSLAQTWPASAAGPTPARGVGSRAVTFGPVPTSTARTTTAVPSPVTARVQLIEAQLVQDYKRHLLARGHRVARLKIREGGATFYNDIFDQTIGALIEAKPDGERSSIRMALGQILDYGHGVSTSFRAVLTPNKLDDSLLAVLDAHDVHAIWRDGVGGFADNAGGALV